MDKVYRSGTVTIFERKVGNHSCMCDRNERARELLKDFFGSHID